MAHLTRIMLIADHLGDHLLTKLCLEEAGWPVDLTCFSTVGEAMTAFDQSIQAGIPPELVIADYHFGSETCVTVVKAMAARRPETVIIVQTAKLHDATIDVCMAAGAAAVVEKPPTYQGMATMLSELRSDLAGGRHGRSIPTPLLLHRGPAGAD